MRDNQELEMSGYLVKGLNISNLKMRACFMQWTYVDHWFWGSRELAAKKSANEASRREDVTRTKSLLAN